MLPDALRKVIMLLARLPGVGEKTAQRFALEMLSDKSLATALAPALLALVDEVAPCSDCNHFASARVTPPSLCSICLDPRRDPTLLCIVARIQDLLAIERSGAMRGRYFVLGRLLSPLDGIGPDQLPIEQLLGLVGRAAVREVILATPPSVDGEATALFLSRELTARSIRVSRIASGVPHGGDLEFADQITLGRAIEGRRTF